MNRRLSKGIAIGSAMGVISALCLIHSPLHFSSMNVNAFRSLASVEIKGSEELMSEEKKQRKIEVCGPESISVDTLSNFNANPTGWFPGRAKVIADPHEALLTKLLMIQKAKQSIDISTYIFTDDETSRAILDELNRAVLRGVNVRFMIDAGGSIGTALTDQYRHLRSLLWNQKDAEQKGFKPGKVDVVIFHPLGRVNTILTTLKEMFLEDVDVSSETVLNWDRRSHDKIFIIDRDSKEDAMAVVGGRNIDNAYYGMPEVDQNSYLDMEVLMTNDPNSNDPRTLGNTLGKHYQNLFCSKGNRWLSLERAGGMLDGTRFEPLEDLPSKYAYKDTIGAVETVLKDNSMWALYSKMKGATGFDFLKQDFSKAKLMPGNEIQNIKRPRADVFVDPNAPFVDNMRNGDSVYYQIRRLVGEADKTVDICTPYIFLSQNERDCFKKWAMEKPGRRVRVLSNSSVTSDSALAMTTFEYESAPELMREGHYRCVDPKTHEVSEGEFDNHDKKIQVYLLGRLDNMMLNKGIVKDSRGRFVLLSEFYGKLHAKFGIVDGRYSFVGSHNLDQRSKHLNSETAFFIDNPKVASVLTQEFEKAIKRSYLYGDPDLEIMNARPEIRLRKKLMTVLDFINKKFPKAGYAN